MKIKDLKDKQGNVNIDLKIIWDKSEPKDMFGKMIKSVLVVDADDEGDGPSAYFDLVNDDCDNYKFQDKIRVINAYSKLIKNNSGQFRITNAKKIELIEKGNKVC